MIRLLANIERADDAQVAIEAGAEGIGLYRSESLLSGGPPDLVGEEEQYDVYRHIVRTLSGRPVTIRTFDIDERQLVRPPADVALDTRWASDDVRAGHGGADRRRAGSARRRPRIRSRARHAEAPSQHAGDAARVVFHTAHDEDGELDSRCRCKRCRLMCKFCRFQSRPHKIHC